MECLKSVGWVGRIRCSGRCTKKHIFLEGFPLYSSLLRQRQNLDLLHYGNTKHIISEINLSFIACNVRKGVLKTK